jgi:hypothetical protein
MPARDSAGAQKDCRINNNNLRTSGSVPLRVEKAASAAFFLGGLSAMPTRL